MPNVEIAKYRLHFLRQNQEFQPEAPPWHAGFSFSSENTEGYESSVFCHDFSFLLHNQPPGQNPQQQTLVTRNDIWELWRDEAGRYLFSNPMQDVNRWVVISSDFSHGEIYGDFSLQGYPLPQDLEIVFFANWLANHGDLILHASGIAVDGQGYAFVGSSGVGKSTLARVLHQQEGVTVLGEDQLVLRLMGDQFWLFGTPWHLNRAMCSQAGVPLRKIFLLDKTDEDVLFTVSPMTGVTSLLQTAFIPYYRSDLIGLILERLDILAQKVPMFHFSYLPGKRFLDRII